MALSQATRHGRTNTKTQSLSLRAFGSCGIAVGAILSFANPAQSSGVGFKRGAASFERFQATIEAVTSEPTIATFTRSGLNQIVPAQIVEGHGLQTTKFQHFFKGIEVVGSLVLHHVSDAELMTGASDTLDAANATIDGDLARFDLSTEPSLTLESIVQIARGTAGDREPAAAPELKILPSDERDAARLTYVVRMRPSAHEEGRDLWIDAHTGETLADLSHHQTIAPISVYSAANQKAPCQTLDEAGWPLAVNATACKTEVLKGRALRSVASESGLRAYENARASVGYFWYTHGRDGFDNQGTEVVNLVSVGKKFANAFWSEDEKIMAYGDGDLENGLRDFTHSRDVAGHELTHAVTSKTANLMYRAESGALNEAFSDFFGILIASGSQSTITDWRLGEEIFVAKSPEAAIRDLANPRSLKVMAPDARSGKLDERPYPATVAEMAPLGRSCNSMNDNCWLHVNSTVFGHGMYRVLTAIGREKSERLFYTVLTQYLTANATFKTAAAATRSACSKLYDTATCGKVSQALTSIGLPETLSSLLGKANSRNRPFQSLASAL